MDLFNYSRRESSEVQVGGIPLGGSNPIRIQSMTNCSTMDTDSCVEQTKRIVAAGGDYVRLTTQGAREATNLKEINSRLRKQGVMVPLIADIHFNPKVAEIAALYAEKIRINPGNYTDAARTFKALSFTDEEYQKEILKIKERFVPLLDIAKANHTAIRLGVNHGSLSDRIMSRYGDTPAGMVESCMEFLRICVEQKFYNVIISIKSSNTIIMVKTVRLLVDVMEQEGMNFPIHLGVTEAGNGEDGRIKSAFGIGALLADGLGDTIRVSLTEAPEAEIPVAIKLRDYIVQRSEHPYIPGKSVPQFNYTDPVRRKTHSVGNIGGSNLPVVVAERFDGQTNNESKRPDYIYSGQKLPDECESGVAYIVDVDSWNGQENCYPAFSYNQLFMMGQCSAAMKFLFLPYMGLTEEVIACLRSHPEVVIIAQSNHPNRLGEFRALAHELSSEELTHPIVFFQHYSEEQQEDFQIKAAADMGALIVDGLCDGIFLYNQGSLTHSVVDSTAYAILQAGRLRMVKTEYISCPGCGRTLYNLEETIEKIKKATSHLKGLKIGIMGCIVNGPGEMADADYGYVGAGRGKISLYKGKVCIEKNIPENEAVDRLLKFIDEDRKKMENN